MVLPIFIKSRLWVLALLACFVTYGIFGRNSGDALEGASGRHLLSYVRPDRFSALFCVLLPEYYSTEMPACAALPIRAGRSQTAQRVPSAPIFSPSW